MPVSVQTQATDMMLMLTCGQEYSVSVQSLSDRAVCRICLFYVLN